MNKIYFIRHGETKANVDGILTGRLETNLTDKGIESAKELGKILDKDFDYYYCSPLKRTHQTLNYIVGDVDFIIDDRVTEVSTGDWQGKYKNELPIEDYNLYKKGLYNPPNGETLEDVDKRIISFLNEVFNKYNDKKILVVTHNAFMRSLKRMFVDNVEEPKNLEVFIVDENMYRGLNNA